MSKEPESQAAEYVQMGEIFKVLQQVSSIGVVSGYLRIMGLTWSASSWDMLFQKRIEPAFLEGTLSIAALAEILRDVEESGKQHVFLYKTKPSSAQSMMDRGTVRHALKKAGLVNLLSQPLLLTGASEATIADVRWNTSPKGIDLSMVVKIVSQRHAAELASTIDNPDGTTTKVFRPVKHRVVHVFKLHRDGTLEVRVASQATSTQYEADLKVLWNLVSFLVNPDEFKKTSLLAAKEKLWVDSDALSDKVRFVDSTYKNDDGYMLRGISSSESGNIRTNSATVKSLEVFRNSDGYCDTQNVYFIPTGDDPKPSKPIHVILGGAINEFAIPANCSHIDYEHVFDELRSLNA